MAEKTNIDSGEEKREKEFSKELESTNDTLSMIKELLEETTSKVIEDTFGFKRNEKVAGVYGDGTTYGAGVEEGEYNVIVTGRPRKYDSSKDMDHGPNSGTVEKQIFIGAKRVESQIDYEIIGNKTLHLQYKSPESGFFRGVDDKGKTYMVNERLTIPLSKAKKSIKDLFTNAATREVGFLTNTKLGVEDRLDASTTSIVETLDMKNLTLKNLFKDDLDFDNINEGEKYEKLPDEEKNIPAQEKLNKIPVKDDKFLLFDDDEARKDFETIIIDLQSEEPFKERCHNMFGTDKVSELTPAEVTELYEALKNEVIEEITTSGPPISGGFKDGAPSGPGGFKPTAFVKAVKRKFSKPGKKSKGDKKSQAGAPWNIPVNDPIYQEADGLNESKKGKKSLKNTSYAKSKKSNRPKIDKDYNVIPEESNASKPYTQVVKIDPNTHPLGMPFVKPNSKEEWERTSGVGRDHDKMKRMGLAESEENKKKRLTKRKFSSSIENKNKGVNKRYIVTEKTNSEYEKDRWKKLSLFSKFETIKESEELNEVFNNIEDYDSFYSENNKVTINESTSETSSKKENSEKTIEVEKPGSVFGITQKFYEKDFLNENKNFILDLNSMVFVKNPNSK
jgi:hypothetical protein